MKDINIQKNNKTLTIDLGVSGSDKRKEYWNKYKAEVESYLTSRLYEGTEQKIDILEALIRVTMKDYNISPNQITIVEKIGSYSDDFVSSVSLKIDLAIPPLCVQEDANQTKSYDTPTMEPARYENFIMSI